MSYLLSIIIPCYNSAHFLNNTIELLEAENLEDCEIILVNDGSTDETLEIIRKYQHRYDNIFYINRENKGVSITRNDGLNSARGEYVYFLDSDDEIEKGTIALFKQTIKEHSTCDFLAFGYKMIAVDGKETKYTNCVLSNSILRENETADLFFRGLLFLNICSIVIKRQFIINNKIVFQPNVKIGEDFEFVQKLTLNAREVYYTSQIVFIYKLREGSATNGHKREYSLDYYIGAINSFEMANKARGILNEKTINYYLASRYSANLKQYLESSYKNKEINQFFITKKGCLYKKMARGRKQVMYAISIFRIMPIKFILCTMKRCE